jgi:hypothetical protein
MTCCTDFVTGVLVLILLVVDLGKCAPGIRLVLIVSIVLKMAIFPIVSVAKLLAIFLAKLNPNIFRATTDLVITILMFCWGIYVITVFASHQEECKKQN